MEASRNNVCMCVDDCSNRVIMKISFRVMALYMSPVCCPESCRP